jgi:hypothetical protein
VQVTVIRLVSLLPDVGEEIDDGDGNPDTKSFVVCVVDPNYDPNVVTVTAVTDPCVPEENLLNCGCWGLEGGTGTSQLFRTVDRTTPDVTTITCTCGSSWKRTKIYVVKVDLTASDLYGTVTEPNEEAPGAFVHFNLDNDDANNNSIGAPKRPGADYLKTGTVSGENDLKSLSMSLSPSLDFGSVVLTIPASAKVWKSATKGSSNLVLASGSKTWNLADPNQRSEFQSLKYVEGVNTGGGNIVLKYNASGAEIHRDTVKYTFIAADCGRQPKTSGSLNERDFATDPLNFPSLVHCEWSITAEANSVYNCIAWSVDETNFWYNSSYIAHNYGNKDDNFEPNDMDDFYQKKKEWSLITSGTDEEKAAQAEAMYYSGYHGARRKTCSCGSGKWIMYESKCGGWVRMEHVWNQLNNPAQGAYGTPIRFYK